MSSDIPSGGPMAGPASSARALTDAELAARLRGGDEAAFEAVFRRYLGPLAELAFSYVGSRDQASDLVQDVFLWIWRNRATWTLQGSLKGYLYRSVRNRAYDAARHQRIERRWAEQAVREERAGQGPSVAHTDDARDNRMAALERAVAALPERRRQVFLLRWRDGLSYAEIAEVMGTSVKTVDNQMARALQAVRRDAHEDFDSTESS